jgi:hypothetical protein
MVSPNDLLVWLTAAYSLATPIIAAVYWRSYGPANFLWLSDIALAFTLISLLSRERLLASIPAVGVLALELGWAIDFLAGGRLIGLAAYMFDKRLSLPLRSLSLFHLALPPTLLFLLSMFGYDKRAFVFQTLLTWVVLLISYNATDPEKNINCVFGPGDKPQHVIPPPLYLALEMTALPLLVFLPTHLILLRLFG